MNYCSIWVPGFLLPSERLIQVKAIETARRDLVKSDRDRLIEVKITVTKGSNFGTLTTDSLIEGDRLT